MASVRRLPRVLAVLVLLLSAQVAAGSAPALAATYPDWPTYHGNGYRTGYAATLKPVSGTPHQVWNVKLDGAVYGSPIIVAGGVVIVATENNSVYRIAGNRVVWRRHYAAPVPQSHLPCGNIDPSGITGTPAYDSRTRTVIAVVFAERPFRHVAVGIDPVTGRTRWTRNVDVPAGVAGISPQAMQQRAALIVFGRRVYIAYGGLAGDCSSYRGSVVGLDVLHPRTAPLWHITVPTSREAGIWAASGPAADPEGGLLVAVGNGATAGTGTYDHSDSVLRLQDNRIYDSFSPSSWRADNAADLDLGSQGPTVVPGHKVFIAGKRGTAYVLNRSHLGGIGGQLYQHSLCHSYGGTAVVRNVVYVPCDDGIRAVRINSDGSFTVLWHARSNISGSPVVGGGRVFALDTDAGRLYLLNPRTGAAMTSVTTGAVTRFATPALRGNAVFVGTRSGLRAYSW